MRQFSSLMGILFACSEWLRKKQSWLLFGIVLSRVQMLSSQGLN